MTLNPIAIPVIISELRPTPSRAWWPPVQAVDTERVVRPEHDAISPPSFCQYLPHDLPAGVVPPINVHPTFVHLMILTLSSCRLKG